MRNALLLLVLCPCSFALLAAESTVHYAVRYPDAAAGRVEVRLRVEGLAGGRQWFVMPRSIPMGYGEQPFDRFVSVLSAVSGDGVELPVKRADGPRWEVGRAGAVVNTVRYVVDVRAMEREILAASDTSKARPGYLGLLGYSVLGYLEGSEQLPVRLRVEGPAGWPVFSTLAPSVSPGNRVEARAGGFYQVADSQIAMGPGLVIRRAGGSVPLFLAVYDEAGSIGPVLDRLGLETAAAMAALVDYLGPAPFPHYTVHLEILKPVSERHSYGFSMEHMDSGTFFLGVDMALSAKTGEGLWLQHRYNFTHHMAHSWIPKRSYPAGYFPHSWELAPVLDTIWLSEGWAQYAAMAALAESLPAGQRDAFVQERLERFRGGLRDAPPFLKRMTLAELSRVASTRYASDFRTGRTTFSRGGMMAYEMDEWIRKRSGGKKSFRDGLRSLMGKRGYDVEELPGLFLEATGVDVRAVMDRWLGPVVE